MSDSPLPTDPVDPVDQQLIELLQNKPPEDLSFEELDLLRARLAQSPALRAALAEQLQTESYLSQVLGDFSVSPETIITRAQAEDAAQSRPWQWILGGIVCVLLVGVLAGVFYVASQPPRDPNRIADANKKKQDAERQQATKPVEKPADDQGADPDTPANENVPPAPKVEVVVGAESFVRGTVKIDNVEFGNPTNVVVHSGGERNRGVEYEVLLPKSGSYFVHLRYAAAEERPLRATLNGRPLDDPFARDATGGLHPQHQKWFTQGQFTFKRGRNLLKLDAVGQFPHLNRIVISSEATISDATAPEVMPAEIAKVEPWTAALENPNPPSYLATAFDEFDTSKSLPQMQDLLRWFETIPNQQRRIGETHTRLGKCAEFDGVFRLRWPWQEHAALRLMLENHNRLRLHFYNGTEGVTLVYYQDEGYTWAAYATTRKDAQTHAPLSLALTATDEGRCARTEYRFAGAVDVRWHAGELLLMRGDIVLLRAPLAAPPKDVYFDGRSAFHGIAVVAAKDSPPADPAPTAITELKPSSLTWNEKLTEGAKLTKHPDGSVELTAENAKGSGFVTAALGNATGPCEVIVELEDTSACTGVYLGPADKRNVAAVRFVKNHRLPASPLCAVLRTDEFREGDVGWWPERVTTHVRQDKQYVRLIGGAGIVRHAISADGIHWAQWEDPQPNVTPGLMHLCLDYISQAPGCRIKVTKITLRALPALAAQMDVELAAKAPVLTNAKGPSIGQWLAEVSSAQPNGAATSAWRRTCALKSLAAGCDMELGQRLLQLVLDDAEARKLPLEELLPIYQEAFTLLETRHNAAQAKTCWDRYFAAAQQSTSSDRPFNAIRRAAMTSPVSWRHNLPVADDKTIRMELVRLLYAGKWEETLNFCRQLRFYQQHQRVPLVEWAEATAVRQLPGRATGETSLTRLRANWRPLLIEELSKDAYNVLAEMQAILDSDAFDDAARMITSISPDSVIGVAPHGRDRQLLVSLPAAIRLAVRDYPALFTVMNEKFGPLAQLRVRQSIGANNAAAVELAAVQFEATEAAAEAHRWLGDRALSSGQFSRAMAEYDRATRTAPVTMKHELAARMRLTAAMQGLEFGTAITRPVIFGETNLSPAEFEAIVAEMKQANATGGAQRVVPADAQRVYPAPAPVGFEAHVRSRFDGAVGNDPNAEITRGLNEYKINWCERQFATLVEGNVLYITNRFQVSAYNLDNGQRMWQTVVPGSMARSRDWSLMPMRPLVTGTHVYARFLYGSGPTLACFEKPTGKLLWASEQRVNEFLISDPLMIQGQLVGLTLQRGDQGAGTLRLTIFDRETGEPLVQHSLARLNEVWWTRRCGEVTPLDDGLIAVLGGVSLCCDLNGNVRWLRRPVSLPPDEEPSWVRQYFDRPLVHENRALLAQPGVRTLECVDADTGRIAWSRIIPDIESVIGLHEGKVILRTQQAFLALDFGDGKELWRHPRPEVFDASLLGGPGGMMYVERQPTKQNKDRFQARLVWVDPATGLAKSSFSIATLEDVEAHFGPLVAYKDRVFAFWGRSNNDATRDVIELVPKGDAPLTPITLAANRDPWTRDTDPVLRLTAERLFADWALLSAGMNGESGPRDDALGEKDVLGLALRQNQPIVFARDFAPAAGSHPKLRLRFNHKTDQEWNVKLRVDFAGETVWSQDFGKQHNPQQWKDLEIDLTKIAGKSGSLVVRGDLTVGGEMSTWWKKIELVP